ncbi:MAG: methionyl-tRNA formyltransferase [Candidatus Buchananbacteria bacterium]|nr:methionyl-tRNA formyltransferase [Candidatus Buchananbacteria bacterium]
MNTKKPDLIFLGTPEFALPALKALVENDFKPKLVITQPDQPLGRHQKLSSSPVKVVAEKYGIRVIQPKNKKELAQIFAKESCQVAVVVAYGMIIPDEILKKPAYGFLNIHPSLLPKYRGSSPIQAALLHGDLQTGVTIIKLTQRVDAGPIIGRQTFDIGSRNAAKLHDALAQLGGELLVSVLPNYLAGKAELIDQDDSQATYTSLIRREDGLVDWNKTPLEIFNQFRAFTPWPGVFTYFDNKRLKILNLSVLEGDLSKDLSNGTVFLTPKKKLAVKCDNGAITLITVQLEGKKGVLAPEFLKGYPEIVGKRLG